MGSTYVTELCPCARHINACLVLVYPRKNCPNITEKLLTGTKIIKSNFMADMKKYHIQLVSSIRYKLVCAYSKDSNQSKQSHNLIKVLVFHLKKPWDPWLPKERHCVDMQAEFKIGAHANLYLSLDYSSICA